MSIERIRAALAAGPTPGPWSVETVPTSCGVCHKVGPFPGRRPGDPPRRACLYADYPSQGNPADDELEANAAFIAACNPAAIHDLLAHIDAQAAEIERLRAVLIAAKELNAESEEYDFDYGLGRGAPNSYWEHLDDALDAVIEQADAALEEQK